MKNRKSTLPEGQPLLEYTSRYFWKNPSPRIYLLRLYNACELYRVFLSPSFDPDIWITIGKSEEKGFVEVIDDSGKEYLYYLNNWEYLLFKAQLWIYRVWNFRPEKCNTIIDSISYWFEFITNKNYLFVGFGYKKHTLHQKLVNMMVRIALSATHKTQNEDLYNSIKEIKTYLY